ncbi:MAG: signal recognition particle-docking protein FtsY [candidate division NC10 bacterium]|nr:signal recognition particle-docking protein FtsY [candidate division NC10 bacterium]
MAFELFSRFKESLHRTRKGFIERLEDLLKKKLDPLTIEELEELLLSADVGPSATRLLLDSVQKVHGRRDFTGPEESRLALKERILSLFPEEGARPPARGDKPFVVLFLGANGSGKTTTIGKLAKRLIDGGHKVLLAAADTFRAGAIEQLQLWGKKVGADVIAHQAEADPSAVVFDALKAAKARGIDHLLIDTAGRLHTKKNLMEELKKINRVIGKELPGAPDESLLVLDATFGSNALVQAREFHGAVGVTGLVIAKLDGTAKGGSVIAIAHELKVPVKYVGTGEGVDDLYPFDPDAFVSALLDPS